MSSSGAATVSARWVGTVGAALAVASAVLHVLAIGSMPWSLGAVMVLLAAGCLTCVPALLRGPTRGTWLVVGVMAGGMLVLHAGAMSLQGGTPQQGGSSEARMHDHSRHGAHHEEGAAMADLSVGDHLRAHLAGEGWDLMHVGSLLAGAELLLAAGAASRLRRAPVGRTVDRPGPKAPTTTRAA